LFITKLYQNRDEVSAFAGHFVSVFSGCFATAPLLPYLGTVNTDPVVSVGRRTVCAALDAVVIIAVCGIGRHSRDIRRDIAADKREND
jgi:hypothetical protein